MTDQEVAYVFEAILGAAPPAVDVAVMRVLSPTDLTAADVAAYMYSHWMGDPDHPTAEQVEAAVRSCVDGGG
jgi:hypothetical protein